MKCAFELLKIREEAILAKEKEEAEKLAQRAKASIQFCEEELGPALVALAERAYEKMEASYLFHVAMFDTDILHFTRKESTIYADGTSSYEILYKTQLSKKIITEYLMTHCITIEWKTEDFYCYGFGKQDGIRLTASVTMDCRE